MNPFPATFESKCAGCGDSMEIGDQVWATDEGYMCRECADDSGYLCECGKFKKVEYDQCFACSREEET